VPQIPIASNMFLRDPQRSTDCGMNGLIIALGHTCASPANSDNWAP